MDGNKVAQLVFPSDVDAPLDDVVLQLLPGIKVDKEKRNDETDSISSEPTRRQKIYHWLLTQRKMLKQKKLPDLLRGPIGIRSGYDSGTLEEQLEDSADLPNDPSLIMSYIPAIQQGSVPMVTERIQSYLEYHNSSND